MKKRSFIKFNYFLICGILSFTYVNGFSIAIADSPYSAGRVYNGSGTQTGSISSDGRVYNGSGTQTGDISSDGRIYNGSGTQTGDISSDGRVYNGSGTQTGSISSDGRVYGSSGALGSVSPDGRVYNNSGQEIGQVPPGNPAVAFGMLSGQGRSHNNPDDGPGSASFERRWNADLDRDNALRRCVALYRGCHRKREKAQCDRFTASAECKSFSAQEIKDADERIYTFDDYKCDNADSDCFEGTNVHSSSCQYIAQYCPSPGTDETLAEVRSGKNHAPLHSQEEDCKEILKNSCRIYERLAVCENNKSCALEQCDSDKEFCTKYLAHLKKKKSQK